MALTADQTARLSAGAIDYEYKIYAGGPRSATIEQDVDEGQPYTATASTTLASAWDGVSTTISLTDASAFPSAGGFYAAYVYTGGLHYAAKFVAYTGKSGNDLTGCTLADQWGLPVTDEVTAGPPTGGLGHPAGQTVSAWAEITAKVTGLDFGERAEGSLGRWEAALSGIDYDHGLLAQNRTILAMIRWSPAPSEASGWSDWEVLFLGYVARATTTDDYHEAAAWTATVRGIDLYLENTDAPAKSYGRANLALGASTTGSTARSASAGIGHDGEIVGLPDLDTDQATDESLSTLFCADTAPSRSAGTAPLSGGYPFIGEVGWGPTGSGADGAYVVIWARAEAQASHWDLQTHITATATGATLAANITAGSPASGGNLTVNNTAGLDEQQGTIKIDSEEINYTLRVNGQLQNIERGANGTTADSHSAGAAITAAANLNTKDVDGLPTIPTQGRMIWCRKREALESWANLSGLDVVEWRTVQGTHQTGEKLDSLRQAGDKLRIRGENAPGAAYQTRHTVSWGTAAESGWPTGAIGYGQALICTDLSDPSNGANWQIIDAPSPGRNASATYTAHIAAEVPAFAITLASTLSGGETEIPITPTAAGLTQSGGTIQLDAEQITYTGIEYVSGNTYRLTGCSAVATGHSAGITVYQVEDGTAHTMERIGRIAWRRRLVLDSAGAPIVPQAFIIWTSTLTSPTYPDDTTPATVTWRADWERVATVEDWSRADWSTPDAWAGARAKHVLMVCEAMSNGGRFLLNELEFFRSADTDPSETAPDTAGGVVTEILEGFGLAATQMDAASVGPIATRLVTARTRIWSLFGELADLTGGRFQILRDNKATWRRHPDHPLGGLPDIVAAFTRSNARRARVTHAQRNRYSQVILAARNPITQESYTATYPNTAHALGEPLEIERTFYGGAQEAGYLAEMIFRQANRQSTVEIVPRGHADGLRLWDRVTLTWDLDRGNLLYSGRNFLIVGITLGLGHPLGEGKRADWGITLREYEG